MNFKQLKGATAEKWLIKSATHLVEYWSGAENNIHGTHILMLKDKRDYNNAKEKLQKKTGRRHKKRSIQFFYV